MQIDRRITNGLAWAGAFLVVGIPAADFAARQFFPGDAPQMAVVQAEAEPVAVPEKPVETSAKPAETVAPAPMQTAAVTPVKPAQSKDAVDNFVQSGRPMPSYITGAEPAEKPATRPVIAADPKPEPVPATQAQPAQAPKPDPVVVAALPPAKVAPIPMPASMRPPPPVAPLIVEAPAQRPLIIENSAPIVTAQDLEDWESGPLSDFLARRQAQTSASSSADYVTDYDPNGFFLDQGPSSSAQYRRFPRAYEDDSVYYSFGQ